MIDLEILRKNPERVKQAVLKKHIEVDVERILFLDTERRALLQQIEKLRSNRNQLDIEQAKVEGPKLKEQLKQLEEKLQPIEIEFQEKVLWLPNFPDSQVPDGESDQDNQAIKLVGQKPVFDFEPKDHEALLKILDLADFQRAAKVAGNRFYYLKNQAVVLEMALMRFALDFMLKRGFQALTVPDIVNRSAMYGTGHFPPEHDAYQTQDSEYLAGTAEIGLINYHADEILDHLPARYCGFSACFRREAGTYGKATGGLFRVHQFHKIEMVSFVKPEDSQTEHEFLLALAEELLSELGLHYRVVINCGGDLGLPQAKKYDIETWMAGKGVYGETHSCSNDTDFQARRLNIKYKEDNGKKEYVHTLNNTVIASPRILIPLLENNQQADGSVMIPKSLVPYCGFGEIKSK